MTVKADEKTLEYLQEQERTNPGSLIRAVRILNARDEAMQEAIHRLGRAHREWQWALTEIANIATRIGAVAALKRALQEINGEAAAVPAAAEEKAG